MGNLHAFDTEKLDWSEVRAAGRPEPRSFHSAASDDTNLYIFGGCGLEGRLNDLHRYDSTSSSWECLPSNTSIEPRGGASLLVYTYNLFLIGGFNGKELGAGNYASDVFGLDPNQPELGWKVLSVKGTAPSPRPWLAATTCSYGIALHGGNAPGFDINAIGANHWLTVQPHAEKSNNINQNLPCKFWILFIGSPSACC
ncbi:hypothetical protein WJX77_002698 [Trebouxia sp. C0004]